MTKKTLTMKWLFLAFCVLLPLGVAAGDENRNKAEAELQPLYMCGVGISFTDSVVYLTEIQYLDSTWVQPSHKFLEDRSLYSLQLQYYMERQGVRNAICTVLFDKKQRKLQRKWDKIRKRHQQHASQRFVEVPLRDFRFQAEEYRPTIIEETKE